MGATVHVFRNRIRKNTNNRIRIKNADQNPGPSVFTQIFFMHFPVLFHEFPRVVSKIKTCIFLLSLKRWQNVDTFIISPKLCCREAWILKHIRMSTWILIRIEILCWIQTRIRMKRMRIRNRGGWGATNVFSTASRKSVKKRTIPKSFQKRSC